MKSKERTGVMEGPVEAFYEGKELWYQFLPHLMSHHPLSSSHCPHHGGLLPHLASSSPLTSPLLALPPRVSSCRASLTGESRIIQVDREKMTWKDLHLLAAKAHGVAVKDSHFSWKTGVCTDLPRQNDSLKKARVYVGDEFELIPYRK